MCLNRPVQLSKYDYTACESPIHHWAAHLNACSGERISSFGRCRGVTYLASPHCSDGEDERAESHDDCGNTWILKRELGD